MVRLKHRYILFDIIYPPPADPRTTAHKEKFASFSNSPKETLLLLHETSPLSINQKVIANLLKRVVDDHFGEIGAGTVGQLIIVKYFSNKTSTGIIRCSRTNFQQVMAAIALVTKVDTRDAIMRCVHVSGTIKKCEQFSIRRSRQLIIEMGQNKAMQNGLDELLEMFGGEDKEEDVEDD